MHLKLEVPVIVFTHCSFFADAMTDLADQLKGAYNIETVVGPIDIKLSNAIMNYQDQTAQITERVRPHINSKVYSNAKQQPGWQALMFCGGLLLAGVPLSSDVRLSSAGDAAAPASTLVSALFIVLLTQFTSQSSNKNTCYLLHENRT